MDKLTETAVFMLLSSPPSIAESTRGDRLAYVRKRYECISNCDVCGICATFGGTSPEQVLSDYIEGNMELREALVRFRNSTRSAR